MTYRIVVGGSGQPVGQIPEVEIESGATWQGLVSFTLANTGDSQPVHFDLFRADKSGADPYRRLTLIVNGTSSNDPAE
jgi:hypothetical protein